MAIRAKYKGNGAEFHEGIPARDIDDDEYQAMDADQRKMLRDSALYDTKTDAQMGSHSPASPAAAHGAASKGGGD